jgi:hypothetical protein
LPSIAQMEEHFILALRNNIVTKLVFHLPWLVFWHQIPWTPHIPPFLHW